MTKNEETVFSPGAALTICRPGRRLSPVVWVAPAT